MLTAFEYINNLIERLFNASEEAESSVVADVVLVSQQPPALAFASPGVAEAVVGYGAGILERRDEHSADAILVQFFSDRRSGAGGPFSGDTDHAVLSLTVDVVTQTASASLGLASWGGAIQDLNNLRVFGGGGTADGLLIADGPGIGGAAPVALYTMAFGVHPIP